VTRNRCVGRTRCDRTWLSDLTSGLGSATIVIGHRVGVRPCCMLKVTNPNIWRGAALRAYTHSRHPAVARNRRVGGARCDCSRLSDVPRGGRCASVVICHRIRVGARRNAKRTGASIRIGPALGAHCHSRHSTVTRNCCVGRTGCHRSGLGDVAGRSRRAPVVICHRVRVRARRNAKRARASVRIGTAGGAHCHR
jgi:hypothetical protein